MSTSYPVLGKPSLRGRIREERLEQIFAMPYPQRMRHLRILRFLVPSTARCL